MSELKLTSPEELFAAGYTCDSYDAEQGIADFSRYDKGTDTVHMLTIQMGLEDLLDNNTERLNNSIGQRFGEGKIVASIPLPIFMDKLGEAVAQKDRKFIKKFLNDSDNARFRTFQGRI